MVTGKVIQSHVKMYFLPHHLPYISSEEKLSSHSWLWPTHTKAYVCMCETCLPYKVSAAAVNHMLLVYSPACLQRFHSSHLPAGLPMCPCLCALSLSPMACHLMGIIVVIAGISLTLSEARHLLADHAESCNCPSLLSLFFSIMCLFPLSTGRNLWPRLELTLLFVLQFHFPSLSSLTLFSWLCLKLESFITFSLILIYLEFICAYGLRWLLI